MSEKYPLSGKSETSLPVAQYFAWVNHGNDGSSEEQTLKNLDFFAWLKDRYGMQLEIYALDAGNFDSPLNTYYDPDNHMAKKNFPQGFENIARRAEELGIKLGVWCGPDGFGNTPEEEKTRFDRVVNLCKKYGFALFKFDLVCGDIREEKKEIFSKMISECRKYCPELIVLNHRIDLGDAQKFATTFLWGGQETYVDILINNNKTAPHHREGALERGLVPQLKRLTEDHGVCLSSCMDYFEDDLILQAFNRALILSPEIYGTPALLRDDEFPRLARIFNLSQKYKSLLVSGIELDKSYGEYAVSRGDGETRIITLRNDSWEPLDIDIILNEEIGLIEKKDVYFLQYHPTQKYMGKYKYSSKLTVTVEPFRVYMAVVSVKEPDDILIEGCDYEVIQDIKENKAEINIIRGGNIKVLSDKYNTAFINGQKADEVFAGGYELDVDEYLYPPRFLASLEKASAPENSEELYEATCFSLSNDSLEYQSLVRAGKTNIEPVARVRDAFFDQLSYKIRGCENSAMFDGRDDTFFDALSYASDVRIQNGCLRIDIKEALDIDSMEIEYFSVTETNPYIKPSLLPQKGDFSVDLKTWNDFSLIDDTIIKDIDAPIVLHTVERVKYIKGVLKKAVYKLDGEVRYIRLSEPMDRIYNIRFYKNSKQVNPVNPHANNLMASYDKKVIRGCHKASIKLPNFKKGSYLSIACNGQHGYEGVYAAACFKERAIGCPDRAPSYPVNYWGHWVVKTGINYTYYLPLDETLRGEKIDVYALICKDGDETFNTDVYLCSPNDSKHGAELIIERI